jgi:hypothetical protein
VIQTDPNTLKPIPIHINGAEIGQKPLKVGQGNDEGGEVLFETNRSTHYASGGIRDIQSMALKGFKAGPVRCARHLGL